METTTLDHDISVLYVTASSFPAGISEAHEQLHSKVPVTPGRKFYGLSRPEQGGEIVYRAAAEALQPDEAASLGLETLVLRKGTYCSHTVKQYTKDPVLIEQAFQQLLAEPGIDPQGYCVEWYGNDADVVCMIRLAD